MMLKRPAKGTLGSEEQSARPASPSAHVQGPAWVLPEGWRLRCPLW